jgi:LPS export ABC transporter protein LptC
MRTSQAARYARWAAGIAILLVVTASGAYVHRVWLAAQARRTAPPAVPATVEKRSAEFAFSKVEKDRTLFTVRASRATEFKDQNRNLLEDVWITIYGQQGGRYDNIHTQQCDYDPASGRIACQGEVQIDLESAEEARAHPGQRVIHIATRNISFNRETGEARTDQAVEFRFPYGEGRGTGVTYSTRQATVVLHRDVELHLPPASGSSEPILLTGGSLTYSRNDHTLRLQAPVRVQQGSRQLTAGSLALELDADLRARRAVASGEPKLVSAEAGSRAMLQADQLDSFFSPAGWAERLLAEGHVRSSRTSANGGEDRLNAEHVELELFPGDNQPRLLNAAGDVQFQSVRPGRTQRLETASLRLRFAPAGPPGQRRIESAETLAPATLEWKTASEKTTLHGRQFTASFDKQNHLRQLDGHGGVQVNRQAGGAAEALTTSQDLAMDYGPSGEWSQMEQSGNVRFRQGDRTAQADRGRLLRATDTILLAGSAEVADPQSRTAAQTVWYNQRTGEFQAEGVVRTSYFAGDRSGPENLAPEPAHITAAKLQANNTTGDAVYSGRARLWQGDAVIQADSIELVRQTRRLEARGNVLADFPQAPGPPPASGRTSGTSPAAGSTLWRVRAGRLTYWSAEGRAHLEDSVSAQSRQERIDAREMDLFLTHQGNGPAQLARAVATDRVTVQQGDRQGTADRADFDALQGKFVLSGGQPTLYDASRGTTTGRQLTFFLASDKIFVDSDEGSRTLTTHRVEK